MEKLIEIRHYLTRAGKDVFEEWLTRLGDPRTQAIIAARMNRLAAGNFGDCKPLRGGVWELRIDWGPGYRVYYARTERRRSWFSVLGTNGSRPRIFSGGSAILRIIGKGSASREAQDQRLAR